MSASAGGSICVDRGAGQQLQSPTPRGIPLLSRGIVSQSAFQNPLNDSSLMSKRSVFCIASSRGRADRIVHDLKEATFSRDELSVLFLDRSADGSPASVARTSTAAPVPAAQSSGEIRGVLGWIAGIRPLHIPGVGPLIAAGPVAAAMGSATVDGIAGGLIDFDVPQLEASRCEARIKEGQILIAVHSENPEKSDYAREIFTANKAESICTMIDVFTPKIPLRNASGTPRESSA